MRSRHIDYFVWNMGGRFVEGMSVTRVCRVKCLDRHGLAQSAFPITMYFGFRASDSS